MATGFAVLSASPVLALNYEFGEVSLSVDSTVSLGTGIRASGQDCRHIAASNGGCPDEQGWDFGPANDDGNINFEQWDFYSAAAKITTDFETRWRNYGAFVRATAFYDYIGYEEAGEHETRFGRRPLVDQYRGDDARNAAGRDIELLDAFVFGNFDVAGQPLTVRLGQQVVNWGESLFIRGGINSYLPLDVAATRTPGSEVREALKPLPGAYFNLGLPASINLETFAFVDWKETELDPASTFFSTNDFFGPGGVYTALAQDDPDQFFFAPGAGNVIFRTDDMRPDDEWQYGVKLGHYASWLNNGTDLGLYFVHYHSSFPILSFERPVRSYYLAQYPEDIRQFGASFNTTIDLFGGTALAGEVSYSPNMPLQLNTDDINILTVDALNPGFGAFARAATLEEDGQTVRGYVREDVLTGQLQTTSTFSTSQPITQALGADNFILLANAGFQYLPSVDDDTLSVLNSPGASSSHPDPFAHGVLNQPAGGYPNRQANVHADSFSWGYRLVALTDYNNAFGTPFTITPSVQFAHDVNGKSAGPIGPGFVENVKTISLGVSARYQSTWQAQVRYTNSFGNSVYNVMSDKDFITASISYAF